MTEMSDSELVALLVESASSLGVEYTYAEFTRMQEYRRTLLRRLHDLRTTERAA